MQIKQESAQEVPLTSLMGAEGNACKWLYFIPSLASRCPQTKSTSKDLFSPIVVYISRSQRCEKPRLTPRSLPQRSRVEANNDPQMLVINRYSVHKAPHLGWPTRVPRPVGVKSAPCACAFELLRRAQAVSFSCSSLPKGRAGRGD